MSELKEDWKKTGKDLGSAFKQFGKTFVRSAKHIADKVDESFEEANSEETCETTQTSIDSDKVVAEVKVEEAEPVVEEKEKKEESNVFNDGSWRETGKDLGKAFGNLGKSIGKTLLHPFKDDEEEDVSSKEDKEKRND